MQVDNLPIY